VVLTGVMRSPLARRRLLASGIPVVETWDLTPTPIDMLVGFSTAGSAARLRPTCMGAGGAG
jgi:LacI family gluconate utilization system Gnt-I transcriptional repressor